MTARWLLCCSGCCRAPQVVVARLHSGRAFEYGLGLLQEWAGRTDGFLICFAGGGGV